VDQTRQTGLDTPITLDLTGRIGTPTQLRLVGSPQHGNLVMGPGGTAVYTPDLGFSGLDDFTYAFTGGGGVSVLGTMHIQVGNGLPQNVGSSLPRTGADTGRAVQAGAGLLLAGLLLVFVAGRRARELGQPGS
jgi:LPXTG-motif cell wall-anchored protein